MSHSGTRLRRDSSSTACALTTTRFSNSRANSPNSTLPHRNRIDENLRLSPLPSPRQQRGPRTRARVPLLSRRAIPSSANVLKIDNRFRSVPVQPLYPSPLLPHSSISRRPRNQHRHQFRRPRRTDRPPMRYPRRTPTSLPSSRNSSLLRRQLRRTLVRAHLVSTSRQTKKHYKVSPDYAVFPFPTLPSLLRLRLRPQPRPLDLHQKLLLGHRRLRRRRSLRVPRCLLPRASDANTLRRSIRPRSKDKGRITQGIQMDARIARGRRAQSGGKD